ncbi:hypothetical protein BDV95DRAFT_501964 [Massariosphaeria phaeospora]|uniref:Zn(2)-C6 fungal-type domain-containing protein n=1 Tax=Massariosphaeria phaeospora TaxID=100035 RepID=A0A7C8I4L7_9PLEO|nr:hypothetical protein BDV95DRAFT_501964 [Massariosphaeria phaeospora]
MSRHSALPSPSGPPSKIAIPRLERRRDPPAQAGVSSKQRVSRACLSCRARKIKCNGLLPRCSNCYENASPCVYASSRKDRLKTCVP